MELLKHQDLISAGYRGGEYAMKTYQSLAQERTLVLDRIMDAIEARQKTDDLQIQKKEIEESIQVLFKALIDFSSLHPAEAFDNFSALIHLENLPIQDSQTIQNAIEEVRTIIIIFSEFFPEAAPHFLEECDKLLKSANQSIIQILLQIRNNIHEIALQAGHITDLGLQNT